MEEKKIKAKKCWLMIIKFSGGNFFQFLFLKLSLKFLFNNINMLARARQSKSNVKCEGSC